MPEIVLPALSPRQIAELRKGRPAQLRTKEMARNLPVFPVPAGKSLVVAVHAGWPRLLPPQFKKVDGEEGHYTFQIFPDAEHLDAFKEMDAQRQAIHGSIGHLSVLETSPRGEPGKKFAIITQLQAHASPKSGAAYKEHAGIRKKYAAWSPRLVARVSAHYEKKGIPVLFLHPRAYWLANSVEAGKGNRENILESYSRAQLNAGIRPTGYTVKDFPTLANSQKLLEFVAFSVMPRIKEIEPLPREPARPRRMR